MSEHEILAEIVPREKGSKSGWKGRIKYQCTECDYQTRQIGHWKLHREQHGKGVPVTCDICGKLCGGELLLRAHKLSHESEERIKCHKCGKVYHITNIESHHCKSAENGFTNQCDICQKTFHNVDYLFEHKKIVHELPELKYFCSICGKGFSRTHVFNKHMKTHEEKIPCEECGELKNPTQMKNHILQYHKPKDFKCETCSKGFWNKTALEKHKMNVHLKLRPYKCRYGVGCEFAYNDTSNRDAHERKKHGKVFTTAKEEKIKAILALKNN